MRPQLPLEVLIHQLLDETITPESFKVLQELLLKDPEARRTYYSLLCTDQLLIETYELPEPLALHANLLSQGWTTRRLRGRPLLWTLASAAAILILSLGLLFLFQNRSHNVTFAASANSHFLIDGQLAGTEANLWPNNETLELDEGVLLAHLTPSIEACFEGPVSATLLSRSGDVNLHKGKAFFQIHGDSPDFKVIAGGATIRHIGTEFGVIARGKDSAEIHVISGCVEISRENMPVIRCHAGKAVAWRGLGSTGEARFDGDRFLRELPTEVVCFEDNFSDTHNTPLHLRYPDVGGPWLVLREQNSTRIRQGILDTSSGYRRIAGNFRPFGSTDHSVTLVSLHTTVPVWSADKQERLDGVEKVTLLGSDGKPVASLIARARDAHQWRLRDERNGTESPPCGISAISDEHLTLSYDLRDQRMLLHHGPSPRSKIVAELDLSHPEPLSGFEISNEAGGDIALRRISARHLKYPPGSR